MEGSTSSQDLESSWEISTSLDIRLGEYFGANSRFQLENVVLNLDSDAIQSFIDQASNPFTSNSKLRVELVHPQTLNPKGGKSIHNSEVLGTFIPLDRKGRPCGLNKRANNSLYCAASIDETDIAFTYVTTDFNATEESTPLKSANQYTVEHELIHAVDYMDPQFFKKEVSHFVRLCSKIGGIGLAFIATEAAIITEATEKGVSPFVSLPSTAAIGGLAITYLTIKKDKFKNYIMNRLDYDSPMEKRAYAMEDNEVSSPTIVYVTRSTS